MNFVWLWGRSSRVLAGPRAGPRGSSRVLALFLAVLQFVCLKHQKCNDFYDFHHFSCFFIKNVLIFMISIIFGSNLIIFGSNLIIFGSNLMKFG